MIESTLTPAEQLTLAHIADEPFWWLREMVPVIKDFEDSFFDLLDKLKAAWQEARPNRINLCFILDVTTAPSPSVCQIKDVDGLQKKQNDSNSKLVFIINLTGSVIGELNMGAEIEPISVSALSKLRQAIVFWLGSDFEILYSGIRWSPKNKALVLKEIKSKKRDLLTMEDYRAILTTHYEQYIRAEAGVDYWFPGQTDKILLPRPEHIFQKSLCGFLRREVDCIADPESMFKDSSRCDIRIVADYDLYFIEIKWIGFSAVKPKDSSVISAENPAETKIESAIAGAYQTKLYIENNNSIGYDPKIKLGILVVYDAYPTPQSPITYPNDIASYPLLATADYQLVTQAPSVVAKKIAKKVMITGKKRAQKKATATKTKASK